VDLEPGPADTTTATTREDRGEDMTDASSPSRPTRRPDDHAAGHGHDIGAARPGASEHVGQLRTVLAMVLTFLVVQVVVGWRTGSLAVLSDAGHMATDALGIGMSLAAITAAAKGARAARPTHRTFGWYRLEILAALANSTLLLGVGVFVVVEAVRRFDDPPDVPSWPVLAIGVAGLAVNGASMALLRHGAAENLNVRGAYLEVVADALGSLAVIVSAGVTALFGWARADALIGAAIGVFIVPRAWRLGRDAVRVLVQAAPAHLDPQRVEASLSAVDGVADVHDLHIWTLTSQMDVVTAHLRVVAGADPVAVLDRARKRLALEFRLTHVTLQVEGDADCEHPDW
jgi:cobalt-zinc-cadmium efflux system protein